MERYSTSGRTGKENTKAWSNSSRGLGPRPRRGCGACPALRARTLLPGAGLCQHRRGRGDEAAGSATCAGVQSAEQQAGHDEGQEAAVKHGSAAAGPSAQRSDRSAAGVRPARARHRGSPRRAPGHAPSRGSARPLAAAAAGTRPHFPHWLRAGGATRGERTWARAAGRRRSLLPRPGA